MANHNSTIFDFGDSGYPSIGTCMMGVRNVKQNACIYIPFKDLHTGITDEDVALWNKIGNETLFPANIERINYKFNESGCHDHKFDQFLNLKITYKRDVRHIQDDAKDCKFGLLKSVWIDNYGHLNQKTDTYQSESFERKIYSGWNGYCEDHVLFETGECLKEYIKRTIKEDDQVKEENPVPNFYKVTIDCSKAINNAHKLAILSFYRFLWSNCFVNLATNTLKLVKEGIDSWKALYYAMSSYNYSAYYGLIYQPGFKSMDDVADSLRDPNKTINEAFTASRKSLYTKMSGADIVSAVSRFTVGSEKPFEGICVTDKLKTLTKDKVYKLNFSTDSGKYLVLSNDKFAKINVLEKHFKLVE